MNRFRMRRTGFTRGLALCCVIMGLVAGATGAWAGSPIALSAYPPGPNAVLQQVVLVARHGIRSPTHNPASLKEETGLDWPDWPVASGQLTPHGRKTLDALMRDIARFYDFPCRLPGTFCLTKDEPVIWADSADDRTRESGQIMADAFSSTRRLRARFLAPGQRDPVFNAVTPEFIAAHRDRLLEETARIVALDRRARPPSVIEGLRALQATIAPQGCQVKDRPCYTAQLALSENKKRPMVLGGAARAASVAENLLLVYVEGLKSAGHGWLGQIEPGLLFTVVPVHDYFSDLTRRHGVLIEEKSRVMVGMIEAFLSGRDIALGDGTPVGRETRVLAFAGHDTTLDALAGHYGIDWHFSDQPDRTAPDTTLAFERWQKPDGEIVYRARVFHQSLASLRAGQGNPNPPQDVTQVPSR